MTGILMASVGTQAAGSGTGEGIRVNLTPHIVLSSDNNGSPWNFLANFLVRNSGKLDLNAQTTGSPPVDPPTEWITGQPDTTEAALYETLVTEVSQSGPATRTGAPLDVWIDCATADGLRIWQIEKSGPGDADWILNVSIRSKSSMVVHDSANIILLLSDEFS